MNLTKRMILLILFLFIDTAFAIGQSLIVYQRPSSAIEESGMYKVEITQATKRLTTFVYISKSGRGSFREWGHEQNEAFHYTSFSFSGSVTIKVTKLNSVAGRATVTPTRSGIGTLSTNNSANGKSILFTLTRPAKLSVEFSDDPDNESALTIFANELEHKEDVPDSALKKVFVVKPGATDLIIPSNSSTVFFPPGVFKINYFQIPPHIKQVYISGGAYIRGYLFTKRQRNNPIKINGRGILSADVYSYHYPEKVANDPSLKKYTPGESFRWYKMIEIQGGSKNLIEGISIIDASAFNIALNADSSIVRNVNINGYRFNNDAITIGGNNNRIENCYIRVNDDGMVLYGNSTTISNCIFWQLSNGSSIQLGWQPHHLSGKNLIDNCDIIHSEFKVGSSVDNDFGFLTAMNVTSGGDPSSTVENFIVSNIRFDTEIVKFLDLRMNKNGKGQPCKFSNFTFKNISLTSSLKNPLIFLNGFDSTHTISHFYFVNFKVNKQTLTETAGRASGAIEIGPFVENLFFQISSTTSRE